MQIPEQTINEIRERADIVEVVSRFVDLRRAGMNYKAVCPFHEEKTPSFVVSPDKQIFHCFGCGQGGNVFSFLMEMEGVSFPESVRSLGKQYGVDVESQKTKQPPSRNDGLYRVNDFAARWFHRNLMEKPQGQLVRDYLKKRGIPEEIRKTFQIGFAPDAVAGFFSIVQRKQVPLGVLRELKLIVASTRGSGGYFDYFRRRLIFPIASPSGRVVGFGGRALDAKQEPKYLNSIESAVYVKRRTLYGLSQAREAIRKERCALVVEGYMDVIALHVHGIEHAVASCGTAITADHAQLLRRLTRKVVLLPDADDAGIDAAISGGAVLMATGMDVSVVQLEKGSDPDDAVNDMGGVKFRKKIKGASDYLQYLAGVMKARQMSPRQKESILQRVSAGLSASDNALRYDVISRDIAKVLGVEPENLKRRPSVGAAKTEGEERQLSRERLKRIELEKTLLRLLLDPTPDTAAARDTVDADDFSDEQCRDLYRLLDSAWENHDDIASSGFQKQAEKAGLGAFAAEIALITIAPGNHGVLLRDTVRRVKELQIRVELGLLRETLQELPEESDDAVAVAEHYARLKQALSEL